MHPLFRSIRNNWPTLLVGVLLVAGVFVSKPNMPVVDRKVPAVCLNRGNVDTPKISSEAMTGTVAGWAFDSGSAVTTILVRAGNTELVRHARFVPRADVSHIHAGCAGLGQPGFSFDMVVGTIPPGTLELGLFAKKADGGEFLVGSIAVDFSQPLVAIEDSQPITRGGANLFTGWVTHPDGPVKVRLLAGPLVLWEGMASQARDDVAKALPAWPSAKNAAFEFTVSAAHLPLLDSPTTFEFVTPAGVKLRKPGPPLQNQGAIGKVLADGGNAFVSPRALFVKTWAWHSKKIAGAVLETEQGKVIAGLKQIQPRARLSEFKDPRFPAAVSKAGFNPVGQIYGVHIVGKQIPFGLQRLVVRVRDGAGQDTVFPGPLVWRPAEPVQKTPCAGPRFMAFLPGIDTHVRASGPLEELQRLAHGGCVAIGIQTRIEYLRTTRGKAHDFEFDPNFPESARHPNAALEMTTASLNPALAMAALYRVPMNLVMDGGVWADSKFSASEHDVVDWLEQDDMAVQWNQWGKSERDEALGALAGSHRDPQLARMMSLNRYNTRFMNYKKRNLQAAVRLIVAHNRQHPDALVSINLDPDEYINPWFKDVQWYDYNPGTLRQFREWLLHLGPYANDGELATARSTKLYDLEKLNKISGKAWSTTDKIDAPREAPNYKSEWQQLWVRFKRHLVAQHYADLARWATEVGLPSAQIRSSQTFLDSRVATRINDVAETWSDQAGVSIEGAKPPLGHLGAIFYGAGSRNEGKPRDGESLLDNVRSMDREWGVVEMHPGTITTPHAMVSHQEAYKTLLTLVNFGATRLTPMWGSSAGDLMVHPEHFRSYDVYDQSPFETQFVWWMQAMRAQPWGGNVWPFGNAWVKSTDGWTAGAAASLDATTPGFVNLITTAPGVATLSSPSLRLVGNALKLQVTGAWPSTVVLSATALLDDGERVAVAIDANAMGRLLAPPGRSIRSVLLSWKNPKMAKITLDEVRITPLAADVR